MSELPQGHRIGAYEIRSLLGRGGMGEVYRAHDSRLRRDVAIKILPDSVAGDADRLARFEREAHVLAALTHPNIAAIYGIEDRALVLELVEGETLAERLDRGAVPGREAIAIARQIAEGLEAAHEAGIVHRDLKPANIKITPAGLVKLLDFGIAKVSTAVHDETRTGTQLGTVIGTAAYMSPEQARGLPVDKRSDIWSYGCVLFELLTGTRAFAKPTSTDTLAAILEREPDWSALPSTTPAVVVALLRRCLIKDTRDRLRDIGEARIALANDRREEPAPSRPPRLAAAVAVASLAIAAAIGAYVMAPRPGSTPPTIRFPINPPPGFEFRSDVPRTFFDVSPDGLRIAFSAADASTGGIWVQALGELDARVLAGTDRGGGPTWSPDGQSIAFFAEDSLKRIDVQSGVVTTICGAPDSLRQTASWGREGLIAFGSAESGIISIVPASGGTPEVIVKRDAAAGQTRVHFPMFLPDGRRFLYLVRKADGSAQAWIAAKGMPPREVGAIQSNMGWIDPGFVVSARGSQLIAQRFDLDTERLVGDTVVVTDKVGYFLTTSRALFAASSAGTIAYHNGTDQSQLTWFDRSGRITGTIGDVDGYLSARISRDGSRIVFPRRGPRTQSWDLWIHDIARNVSTPVTSDAGVEVTPVWTADGRDIVYGADRGGASPHLYRRNLETGVDTELRAGGPQQQSMDVSPDGRTLGFMERGARGNFELFSMPLERPQDAAPIGAPTRFLNLGPYFSMDGRAFAYASTRAGRLDVYVAPLSSPAAVVSVSPAGGLEPRWTRDGRELTYLALDGRLMSVPIRTSPGIVVGAAAPLFSLATGRWVDYETAADGRFLAVVLKQPADVQPIVAVMNWRPPGER